MFTSISDLILEFTPFFALPIVMITLSTILRIIKDIVQSSWIEERGAEKAEENVEEKPQKISIDKDLQKYFNYKE